MPPKTRHEHEEGGPGVFPTAMMGLIAVAFLVSFIVFLSKPNKGKDMVSDIDHPYSGHLSSPDDDIENIFSDEYLAVHPEMLAPIELPNEVIAGSAVKLYDFSQDAYAQAVASHALVVLYFFANWCPVCATETENALYPAFDELKRGNIIGFRVNFNDSDTDDDERALAREFGVAYQHTKVFVRDGERILKSPESWTKSNYLFEIDAALK